MNFSENFMQKIPKILKSTAKNSKKSEIGVYEH